MLHMALALSAALLASSGSTLTVALMVELPPGVLLSRFAPNQLTLSVGGQTQTLKLLGTPNNHADYADYFGTVEPLRFRLPVATGEASKALKQGTLSAQLFICDKTARLCTMRTLKLQVTLGRTLRLTEAQLQSSRLFSPTEE